MTEQALQRSLKLWTRRLARRKSLLAAAEQELAQARAQNIHPRAHLVAKVLGDGGVLPLPHLEE